MNRFFRGKFGQPLETSANEQPNVPITSHKSLEQLREDSESELVFYAPISVPLIHQSYFLPYLLSALNRTVLIVMGVALLRGN
jgi:hypothetical protein